MRFLICSHSIYKNKSLNPLDDLSLKELRNLEGRFDLSFDDGYKSVYSLGKEIFKNSNSQILIFINPNFIEQKATVWWLEIYEFILKNEILNFKYNNHHHINLINTKRRKVTSYKYLSKIFKNLDPKNQEILLSSIKGSNKRNCYKEKFMNWEMIRELSKLENVKIGSHTNNHINLSASKTNYIKKELNQSKKIIEEKIDLKIDDFAIPYGDYKSFSDKDIKLVFLSGYKKIYTTEANFFKIKIKEKEGLIINRVCTRRPINKESIIIIRVFLKTLIRCFHKISLLQLITQRDSIEN